MGRHRNRHSVRAAHWNRASWRLAFESLEPRAMLAVSAGTWTQLTNAAPTPPGTMMLLSNGTVMAQGFGVSKDWYQLTPTSTGSYSNGTWSSLASMGTERLYFASNVLQDGRVFVLGGEYSGASGSQNYNNTGEVYDPVANTWTPTANFPKPFFGDDPTEILPDGRILAGYVSGPDTFIYNPTSNSWATGGTKLRNDASVEETWVLLPDGSVLSYDVFGSTTPVGHSQRYIPSSNTWVDAGDLPVVLSGSSLGFELGPAALLADGRVFFIGANSNTAFYDTATNTWTAGPTIPGSKGSDDAPAAVLPNGHVIFTADTPVFNPPAKLFDFDPSDNSITEVTTLPAAMSAELSAFPSYIGRMLVLPSGQILFATGASTKPWIFTPSDSPLAAAQPTISSIVKNGDGSFTLTGTKLNGINEGASYGDDAEMSSNYPIVRLTDSGGNVYYARTFNWSKTGVATGSASVTTKFTLPSGLPDANYSLVVIANGVASATKAFSTTPRDIDVQGNGVSIADGDVTPSTADDTDFGAQVLGFGTITHTFTVANLGIQTLSLTGSPRVQISGANAGDFSVITQPPASVGPQSSKTFKISFNPTAVGVRRATVTIASDDPDEGTYDFAIQGTGSPLPTSGLIEGFENGNLSLYEPAGGKKITSTIVTSTKHDGSRSLQDGSGTEWIYRDDVPVSAGDTISVWLRFAGKADGRAYFGFGSTSTGTLSLVAAPNTKQLILQNNTGYGSVDLAAVSHTFVANHWYKLEVKWGISGSIVGNLYNSDGVTLLSSVNAVNATITTGGFAFRGTNSTKQWDSVFLTPDANSSLVIQNAGLASSANALVIASTPASSTSSAIGVKSSSLVASSGDSTTSTTTKSSPTPTLAKKPALRAGRKTAKSSLAELWIDPSVVEAVAEGRLVAAGAPG